MSCSIRERRKTPEPMKRRERQSARRMSRLLRHGAQDLGHRRREAVPTFRFLAEPFSSGSGQSVVLRAPIVVRYPPFRVQQRLTFQAIEGGIERALLDQQRAAGDLLDPQQHAVTM